MSERIEFDWRTQMKSVMALTSAREHRGWSRAELARRSGLNAATVGQIELRRLQPYPSQLAKLAAALDWSGDPAALLDEVR